MIIYKGTYSCEIENIIPERGRKQRKLIRNQFYPEIENIIPERGRKQCTSDFLHNVPALIENIIPERGRKRKCLPFLLQKSSTIENIIPERGRKPFFCHHTNNIWFLRLKT